MIRVKGTRVDLYTIPGKVGVQIGRTVEEIPVEYARQLATRIRRAADEAEERATAQGGEQK